MSVDALGLVLLITFSFMCGRDYNPNATKLTSSDASEIVFFVWAILGMSVFLFDWFSFQGCAQ